MPGSNEIPPSSPGSEPRAGSAGAAGYDPGAVRAKYLAEREKRMVPGRTDIRDLRTDEILGCLERIADRFDLVSDALFHTEVTRTVWNEDAAHWRIRTNRGDEVTCRWYVLAVGILNLLKLPAIPGMEDFAGHSFHTGRWDYDYTGGGAHEPLTGLADKSVALIGVGASGIQCLPPLAEAAKHVFVFQRTPSAVGVRGNRPTDPDFARGLQPGWQRARMDNFQAIILGRPVEVDPVDDGCTQHWSAVLPA